MTTVEIVKTIAHKHGLAVGIVYDPDAASPEAWIASIGLEAMGAGGFPSAALSAALLDLDRVSEPDEPALLMALPF